MIISPFLALTATPSISTLTNSSAILSLQRRRLDAALRDDTRARMVDHVFELVAVVLQEALHRPRRRIAERADRVPLDVIGDIEQEIQLIAPGVACEHAAQEAIHPTRTLAARRALATGLGHITARATLQHAHHAGGLIH